MKKKTALKLIATHVDDMEMVGINDENLTGILDRWPVKGSKSKAMRWLGFVQGAMYVLKLCSLEDLKTISKYESDKE